MTTIKINMFGIGSIKISTPQKTIYVDTFAEQVKPVMPDKVDLILITHNAAIAKAADRIIRLRSGRIIEEQENPSPVAPEEIVW